MVQSEPSLTLTLEALGPSGVVLSTEIKAALSHSLPLKRTESALSQLTLWGKIAVLNGRDYLIAESTDGPHLFEGAYQSKTLYFCSQNGIKWVDLPPVAPQKAEVATHLRSMLTGDTSTVFYWPPRREGEEDAAADEAPPAANRQHVTELERLRAMVDEVAAATSLAPVGCVAVTAKNDVVPNPLFSGLPYPDKLESYFHLHEGPKGGRTAACDVRGSWTLHYDAFKQVTVCRNLLFPGYSFFYARGSNTWGSFYSGDGLKNTDLIFML